MTKKAKPINMRAASPADQVIGEQMRARRMELHMSQDELGKKLGVSFQQIQKYEKGTNRISVVRMLAIAEVLDVSTDYFLAEYAKHRGQTNGQAAFSKFMASKDGVAVVEAMVAISRPSVRAKVIQIARELAG